MDSNTLFPVSVSLLFILITSFCRISTTSVSRNKIFNSVYKKETAVPSCINLEMWWKLMGEWKKPGKAYLRQKANKL
jgi:archaellum biogenesis protein FlaJ (TadC family)